MKNYTFVEYLKERDPEQYDEIIDTAARYGVAALRGLGSMLKTGAQKAVDIGKETIGKATTAAGEAIKSGIEAGSKSLANVDMERLEDVVARSTDPVFKKIMVPTLPKIKAVWEKHTAAAKAAQPAKPAAGAGADAARQASMAKAGDYFAALDKKNAAPPAAPGKPAAAPAKPAAAPARTGAPRANVDLGAQTFAFPSSSGKVMRRAVAGT